MKTHILLIFVLTLWLLLEDSDQWLFSRRRRYRSRYNYFRYSRTTIQNTRWIVKGDVNMYYGRYGGKRKVSGTFDVNIKLNPCFFGTYDMNNDGNITRNEMMYMFENHKKENKTEDTWVKSLVTSLDSQTVDGVITKKEFQSSMSVIKGC